MQTQFKNLTAEDQQIMSFTSATVSYLDADRADASIMSDAQRCPRTEAVATFNDPLILVRTRY